MFNYNKSLFLNLPCLIVALFLKNSIHKNKFFRNCIGKFISLQSFMQTWLNIQDGSRVLQQTPAVFFFNCYLC